MVDMGSWGAAGATGWGNALGRFVDTGKMDICTLFESPGWFNGFGRSQSSVEGGCCKVVDWGREDTLRGTSEVGMMMSSSSSETSSLFAGSSQWACCSALTHCFRLFRFSARSTERWNKSGGSTTELIAATAAEPGSAGVVSSGSEGGLAHVPWSRPRGLSMIGGIFEIWEVFGVLRGQEMRMPERSGVDLVINPLVTLSSLV